MRVAKTIRIVAALIQDAGGRVLLVRKKGTKAFMQPGGKLRDAESDLAALARELGEELMCSIRPQSAAFLGRFSAPAANERGCIVDAALYRVELAGSVKAAAEIEEILWLDLENAPEVEIAPLTEMVLRLAKKRNPATLRAW
jgi:8-oxo-dGTP pyrophosphatase MutT (NUDIX family)